MCPRLQSFRFAVIAALLGCCGLARAQVDEDTLKAAFVYNFALYTTWPTPVRDASALTVCVPRTSTLAPALRALSGKSVQTRVLTIRETDVEATGSGCDVRVATTAVPMKREAGVLTVCDCDDTIETSGAVVMLVREGSRLRFDVDLGAASASGLSLSSKLLKLARTTR